MTQRVLPSGGMPDSQRHAVDRALGGTRRTSKKVQRLFFTRSDRGKKSSSPAHPAVQQQSQSGGEQGGREPGTSGRVARPRGPCRFSPPPAGWRKRNQPTWRSAARRPAGTAPGPAGPAPPSPMPALSRQAAHLTRGSAGGWPPPCRAIAAPAGSWRRTAAPPRWLRLQACAPQSPADRAAQPGKDGRKGGAPPPLRPDVSAARSPHRLTAAGTPAPQASAGTSRDSSRSVRGSTGLERGDQTGSAGRRSRSGTARQRPPGAAHRSTAGRPGQPPQGPAPAQGPHRHPPLPQPPDSALSSSHAAPLPAVLPLSGGPVRPAPARAALRPGGQRRDRIVPGHGPGPAPLPSGTSARAALAPYSAQMGAHPSEHGRLLDIGTSCVMGRRLPRTGGAAPFWANISAQFCPGCRGNIPKQAPSLYRIFHLTRAL